MKRKQTMEAGRSSISFKILKEETFQPGVLSPVKCISGRKVREPPDKAEKIHYQ